MPLFHKGSAVLETDRLLLRPFLMSDAVWMYDNWAKDPRVTEYLLWRAHPNLEATREVLSLWTRSYVEPDFYLWAIVLKELQQPIGSISIIGLKEISLRGEIGYCIGYDYWGQGITTEALKKVIEFGFKKVGFERLQATHFEANPASGRVMQKAGMKKEGVLRHYLQDHQGNFTNSSIWAIISSDLET